MAYIFTKHFAETIGSRNLDIMHVHAAMENPDLISQPSDGTIIYTKKISETLLIRLIFVDLGADQRLITGYYSSKFAKYLPILQK